MIPCPIVEGQIDTLSVSLIQQLHALDHFVVERAKTARHFIKASKHPQPIADLTIFEIDKNHPEAGLASFLNHLKNGISIGVISEAGCPGIADPGALCVKWAHQHDIRVVPLVGPSSILLALMASGMSGQNFTFHGYLPAKKPELAQALKQLEKLSRQHKASQIFMETPYRNMSILEAATKSLSPATLLCVASNINHDDEWIKTQSIAQWKNQKDMDIHKKPSIFIIGN